MVTLIPQETLDLVRQIVERERLTPRDMLQQWMGSEAEEIIRACNKRVCSGPLTRPTFTTRGYYCSWGAP